jgi:hypothetical protein
MEDADAPSSNKKGWQVAFGVVTALLVIAVIALIVLAGDDDSDETSTAGTTSTVSTATTISASTTSSAAADSSPTSADSEPVDLECSSSALLDVIDPSVVASDGVISEYACAPATVGDPIDAYAWARVTAPNVNDLVVLYSGYVGTEPAAPMPVEWTVLAYGSDITCQEYIPAASCDMLPGVPR